MQEQPLQKQDRRFDAVIFDLFGTIVDLRSRAEYDDLFSRIASILSVDAEGFSRAWYEIMRERDLGLFGGVHGDFEQVLRLMGKSSSSEAIARAIEERLRFYSLALEPRAHAVETITGLKAMGYRVGLISACSGEIVSLWNDTPFSPLMDAAILSCVEGVMKPEPRIYHLACERLGVAPERCVYVGDGGYDELTGAKSVGMHAVLIERGYTEPPPTPPSDIQEWDGPGISELPEILGLL